MASSIDHLSLALHAFDAFRTEAKVYAALRAAGIGAVENSFRDAPPEDRARIGQQAEKLEAAGVSVLIFGDPDFPQSIVVKGRPAAPILFLKGNRKLLSWPGIGMCGSRNVSELGLKAAKACGYEVSGRGFTIVSGYAKGVDTETHLAALTSGGSTVIVLAEGMDHFRVKKSFNGVLDLERTLVVSQFPPTQPWTAYGAMARNKLIYGLGHALVVIEAGERGGTLAAGEGALRMGRPVFVLNFGDETAPGNLKLLRSGGRAVTSRERLGSALTSLFSSPKPSQQQLPL